ncbi:hypothetical protein HOY81_26100 [Streptomyces sp. JJ36]|nr:hypothetical protein [Streptomyces sp. JJ36]
MPQQRGTGRRPARGTPARPRTGPPGRRDPRRPAAGPVRPAGATPRSPVRQPPPQRWFAEQLLLVLSGRRPAHALLRHLRGPAYDQLLALAFEAPLRPGGPGRPLPRLAAVGARQPRTGVLEAFARIATGARVRAMAFRLEAGADRRWRCSALELDGLPPGRPSPA